MANSNSLTETAGDLGARRVAEKAAQFLKSEPIKGADYKIPIPQGAKVVKPKGGQLNFFDRCLSPNNHIIYISNGAKYIQFPEYRVFGPAEQPRHIYYGNPKFYNE